VKPHLSKPFKYFLAATLGLGVFYQFGGPIWRPVKDRMLGAKTVGQVTRALETEMREKFPNLKELTDGRALAILGFKEERSLELWKHREGGWELVRSYPFTGFCGTLGPKLREGDLQIPEGAYEVVSLNPNSSYHLSMEINYPNEFDRKMASREGRENLGFAIFIHGSDATAGCIPVGDENIEEIFYLIAKNGFRKTEVLIFPRDFRKGKPPTEIEGIDWESELYSKLADRAKRFPIGLGE